MLPVEKLRTLRLETPAGASGDEWVQAASGLAIVDGTLYVVSDDELYLAVFRDMGARPGVVTRLLEGRLPRDDDDRKEAKPDLESLTPLGSSGTFPDGALVALGSGSSSDRRLGACAVLAADGSVKETFEVDAGPLFEALEDRIEGVNLEGTAITGDRFRVLQRGNRGGPNAHVDIDLAGLVTALSERSPLAGSLLIDVVEHDLANLRGVPLCFSDADTMSDGRIVFSASAEDDSGDGDGPSIGSAIGVMSQDGAIEHLEPIDVEVKVEGVGLVEEDNALAAYMVTDEDDPGVPTDLWRVEVPLT